MIIRKAIERHLSVADFDKMTVGMVVDYLIECQNAEIDAESNRGKVYATQTEIDAF